MEPKIPDYDPESGLLSKLFTLRIIFFAMQAGQIIFLAIASYVAYSGKMGETQTPEIVNLILLATIGINLTGSVVFGLIIRRIVTARASSLQQGQEGVFTMLLISMALTESSGLLAGINIILGNSLQQNLCAGIFCIAFQWLYFPTVSKFQTANGIDSTENILRP